MPAVIVEDRGQIEPAPADHLEVGEIGLPQLVGSRCLVPEIIRSPDYHVGGSGDQVFGFENAVGREFRHKKPFLIGVFDRQIARCQALVVQREVDEVLADIIRNAIPNRPRSRQTIGKPIEAVIAPPGLPGVVCAAGDAECRRFTAFARCFSARLTYQSLHQKSLP